MPENVNDLVLFIIFSTIMYIGFVFGLKKFYESGKEFPLLGNVVLQILLIFLFIGFHGVIFRGGTLIETLHLHRSEALQLTSLVFGVLYVGAFVRYRPKW